MNGEITKAELKDVNDIGIAVYQGLVSVQEARGQTLFQNTWPAKTNGGQLVKLATQTPYEKWNSRKHNEIYVGFEAGILPPKSSTSHFYIYLHTLQGKVELYAGRNDMYLWYHANINALNAPPIPPDPNREIKILTNMESAIYQLNSARAEIAAKIHALEVLANNFNALTPQSDAEQHIAELLRHGGYHPKPVEIDLNEIRILYRDTKKPITSTDDLRAVVSQIRPEFLWSLIPPAPEENPK